MHLASPTVGGERILLGAIRNFVMSNGNCSSMSVDLESLCSTCGCIPATWGDLADFSEHADISSLIHDNIHGINNEFKGLQTFP